MVSVAFVINGVLIVTYGGIELTAPRHEKLLKQMKKHLQSSRLTLQRGLSPSLYIKGFTVSLQRQTSVVDAFELSTKQ